MERWEEEGRRADRFLKTLKWFRGSSHGKTAPDFLRVPLSILLLLLEVPISDSAGAPRCPARAELMTREESSETPLPVCWDPPILGQVQRTDSRREMTGDRKAATFGDLGLDTSARTPSSSCRMSHGKPKANLCLFVWDHHTQTMAGAPNRRKRGCYC